MTQRTRAAGWLWTTARIAVGCAAFMLLLALLAHLPPLRRAALAMLVEELAARGIVVQARELRYNLLSLRAGLTAVAVAADHSPDSPFFAARRVEVALSGSVLFGRLAFDDVAIDDGRVTVIVLEDGTANLPRSRETAGRPAALPIEHGTLRRMGIRISDERNDLSITIPSLDADLRSASGSLQMNGSGQLRWRSGATALTALGGGFAFDGRAVRLTRLVVASPAASVVVDGSVAVLVDEAAADLRVSGRAAVSDVAGWFSDGLRVGGTLALDGTIKGPLDALSGSVRIRSDRIDRDRLALSKVEATVSVSESEVDSQFQAIVASGLVRGTAVIARASGKARASLSWTDLQTDVLLRALVPEVPLSPAASATGRADVRGAFADPRGWEVDAVSRLDALPAARGELALSGEAAARIARAAWRLDMAGAVQELPLRLTLGGHVNRRSIAASTLGGSIAVRDAPVATLTALLRTAGIVDTADPARLGGTFDLDATLDGTFADPRVRASVTGRHIAVQDVSDLFLTVTAQGSLDDLAVEARVRHDHGEAAAAGAVRPRARELHGRVTGRLADPSALVRGAPVGGVIDVLIDGGGPFDRLQAQGTIGVTGARYRDLLLGALSATLAIEPEATQFDVAAPDLQATARGSVDVTSRRITVDFDAPALDLERLARRAGSDVAVSGSVALTGHAEGLIGDWRRLSAAVDIARLDARVGDVPVRLDAPVSLGLSTDVLSLSKVDGRIGQLHLTAEGRLAAQETAGPVPDAVDLVLSGDLAEALEVVRGIGRLQLPAVQGRGPLTVRAAIAGSVGRPVFRAALDAAAAEVTVPHLPPFVNLVVDARLADGRLALLRGTGEWQGSRVSIDGGLPVRLLDPYLPSAIASVFPRAEGPAQLNAAATAITQDVLAPWLGPDSRAQLDGVVEASIRLEAPALALEDLRGELRLERASVRVAGLPIEQEQPTRIVVEGGEARVAAWDWSGQGAALAVRGSVGLSDRRAALEVDGRIDLRLLRPFVRNAGLVAAGTLAPRLSITGPLDAPVVAGRIALTGGEARLQNPRLAVTDLIATASLAPRRVDITSVSGSVNGGRLSGGGELRYPVGGPVSGTLTAKASGFALEFPEGLRTELDAELTLAAAKGAEGVAGTVTGLVTVTRGGYREPFSVVNGLLRTARTRQLTHASATERSFADRLTLDVRVVTDADVGVDNNLARLDIGGDLRVIGTAAAPTLSGRAELREGGELFLGRNRYLIESGTIGFANSEVIEPNVNVQAVTRAAGEQIELTLKGTPETLDVTLRSPTTPALGQADLASLLLTGRRLDQVSGAEGQILAEQAVSYLSGDLLGAASRVVGLDTLRLGGVDTTTLRRDPSSIVAKADPTSRLTFGKSVGDRVDVTFSQSLRAGDAQTWLLDYYPGLQANIRLASDDETLRSYEFRHEIAVGAASAARTVRRPASEVTVASVDIAGTLGRPERELREVLSLGPGDRFQPAEWQRDRDRLAAALQRSGHLEARVRSTRRQEPSGVALSYAVDAGPRTAIRSSGFALSPAAAAAIEQAWAASILDEFLEQETIDIVRRALASEGYVAAEVAAEVTAAADEPTGVKTLTITVRPGVRALRRVVRVESGDRALDARRREWIAKQGLDAASWQAPERLQRALEAYERARGHAAARVTVAPPRFEGSDAVVVVSIDAGPASAVGVVDVTGARTLATDDLRSAMALPPGAPYDPQAVEAGRERVVAAYRRAGFAEARVSVEPHPADGTNAIDVRLSIDEGPRQVVREIAVHGNRGTDADIITRALAMDVGDPIGTDAWLAARARLFDTALFRRVDVAIEPMAGQAPDPAVRPIRIRVSVEEWPALRLRYGLQISEVRPERNVEGRELVPGFSADLTRRRLFGRAVTMGGALEYLRGEHLARAVVSTPTLLGRPVESMLTLQRSRETAAGSLFVTDINRIAWEQRATAGSRLRVSYSYGFERNHTFNPDAADDPLAYNVTVNIARLSGSAVYDSRDDVVDPTRGLLLSSSIEVGTASLGSDLRFVRHLAQAYRFERLGPVVLASGARVGTVTALGDQLLIPTERFFAGGSRTVRGVADDSLGPRDVFGDAAGGGGLLVLNQEARFPIAWWFRGVVFVDAGNVFAGASGIRLTHLTGSAGAGLRIATPFTLLRMDYGRLWSPAPDQRGGRWVFGIGHAF